METLLWIALSLALLVAAVLVIASRRPDQFRVTRSQSINAPPERLFELINNLRIMNTWNPFALRDPNAQAGYAGPEGGRGALHTFAGSKSGTGSLEILDAKKPSAVTMRLQMAKPFKADNTIEFALQPQGAATVVSWTMSGKQPLLAKAMTLFVDCDKMVGREFESGLANLKAKAEAA